VGREDIIEPPDSIEYAKAVQTSYLFTGGKNPELDEEFDLLNLGIDLSTTESLLSNVYFVGSDAPMVNLGQYPAPDYYPSRPEPVEAASRLHCFSDEALFFVFHLHAQDRLQELAARELRKRRYVFDEKEKRWLGPNGWGFDVENWRFAPVSEIGRIQS
jgi:hypothetical protein